MSVKNFQLVLRGTIDNLSSNSPEQYISVLYFNMKTRRRRSASSKRRSARRNAVLNARSGRQRLRQSTAPETERQWERAGAGAGKASRQTPRSSRRREGAEGAAAPASGGECAVGGAAVRAPVGRLLHARLHVPARAYPGVRHRALRAAKQTRRRLRGHAAVRTRRPSTHLHLQLPPSLLALYHSILSPSYCIKVYIISICSTSNAMLER